MEGSVEENPSLDLWEYKFAETPWCLWCTVAHRKKWNDTLTHPLRPWERLGEVEGDILFSTPTVYSSTSLSGD